MCVPRYAQQVRIKLEREVLVCRVGRRSLEGEGGTWLPSLATEDFPEVLTKLSFVKEKPRKRVAAVLYQRQETGLSREMHGFRLRRSLPAPIWLDCANVHEQSKTAEMMQKFFGAS
jgi:hypothetical protein